MKTRHLFRIIPAVVVIGLALVWTLPTLAASVTFGVATVQANTGSTVEVPIHATGASNLGAIHLELDYDPQVLTPENVTRGKLTGSKNALIDFNTAKPGRLVIGLISLDAINGDGDIALVHFKVIGQAGTSSTLTLENSKAWETATHAEVLVKTEAGKVSVGGGFPYLVIALLCIALLIFLVIFMMFIFWMRQRRTRR